MPTIAPPAKVLVTGANGFLGLWQVRELLERGYSVRGQVRTTEKGEKLKVLVRRKQPKVADKFEYVVVPDIAVEGAFDEAVKGVDAIIHGASPVTLWADDPQEVIRPARDGAISLLKSAVKYGAGIKRVVFTSSIVASMRVDAPPRLYTENDWNEGPVLSVQELGKGASGPDKYDASKVLSEKAAWEIYNAHKHEISWDLTVIQPAYVFGPLADDPPTPAEMTSTQGVLWLSLFSAPQPSVRLLPYLNIVDVRDVTEAHIRALEVEAAAGERILATAQQATWQDWLDVAKDLNLLPRLEKTWPDAPKGPFPVASNEKSKRILRIEYRSVSDTLKAIVEDFSARGWLRHLE